MKQYLIYITDGSDSNCLLITSNKSNAKRQLNNFKNTVKRNNCWFELREYENTATNKYKLLEV